MLLRRLALVVLALAACPLAVCANEKRLGYCQTQNVGTRVTGCTVEVFVSGTLTHPPGGIFQDNLNTPQANPFTADLTTGQWSFYVANGRYDVQFSGGSPTISPAYSLSDFLFNDPFAVGSVSSPTYVLSQTANASQSGFVRMAPGDCLSWRNNANVSDNCLTENASDLLTYGGNIVAYLNTSQTWLAGQTFNSAAVFNSNAVTFNGATHVASENFQAGLTSSSPLLANGFYSTGVPAAAGNGVVRLATGDLVCWRNFANNGDACFAKLNGDQLFYGGIPVTQTIASGSFTLPSGAISSNSCAAALIFSATGVVQSDTATWSFASDPSSIAGYGTGTTGPLSVYTYPLTNQVGLRVCNLNAVSITPGLIVVNWRVTR